MRETEQGGSPLAATGHETGSLIPGNPTGRFLSHAETNKRPAACLPGGGPQHFPAKALGAPLVRWRLAGPRGQNAPTGLLMALR